MTIIPPTSAEEIERVLEGAAKSFEAWSRTSATVRGQALVALADRLDENADELVAIAGRETHLPEPRLRGEIRRTSFQLRLFADVIVEGDYLDVRIDHADADWPMGAPRPDLRRTHVPLGPTVVFAASNFPFAFSVLGGDTASALAAGCSVILKAHSGHPELSQVTARLTVQALVQAGAPEGLFSVVFGTEAGRIALTDPRVKAGAFTGSIPGGRTLFDLAVSRPVPIPFFGELGSTNPVFVARCADSRRGENIADGFLQSLTLGAGQFCTKPGILFVPEGSSIPERLRASAPPAAARLLNTRIQAGYVSSLSALRSHPAVSALIEDPSALSDPPTPTVLHTDIRNYFANRDVLAAECFGPAALVVSYADDHDLIRAAEELEGQLTASIFGDLDDAIAPELIARLSHRAGRVLWNQWPTGVSVTYAQQHGGPYPATTAPGTTSVGTAAIARFIRPVAYQGFPQELLPDELRDHTDLVSSRRIDGALTPPADAVIAAAE